VVPWQRSFHGAKTAPDTPLIGSRGKDVKGEHTAMSIAQDIIGTHYRYPDYFEVDREKIREFARAVKDDHPAHYSEEAAKECGQDALIASLTFLAVAGRRVQLEIFEHFDVPINMERVLHRDQKLTFHRPIVAGDKLYFDSYLDSVIESHGAVVSEIRGEVSDADGNPVITSVVTVIGEAESPDEADDVTARIAARRDEAIAKMVAGQSSTRS
jgi:acyl dehydratase